MTLQEIMTEVKTLSLDERKTLITFIVDTMVKSPSAEAQTQSKPRDIMEFAGLGAEIWQGIDVDAYIREMRDEWDRRV